MISAIPLWDIPSAPIVGTGERFPVRHIYCVGRNYAEHAKEMGGDATKEPPFFFTKAADSIVPVTPPEVGRIRYPLATSSLHHEIELVVAIGKAGRATVEDANEYVFGYAVGLDMTRRDLQNEMREKKRLSRGAITLDVNGARRQQGDLADMIWDVPHTLAFLSKYYELMPGDLVFSGTPSGVGAVVKGDRLEGRIEGLTPLTVEVE
jgi:fumarylpyruvate hydrolase